MQNSSLIKNVVVYHLWPCEISLHPTFPGLNQGSVCKCDKICEEEFRDPVTTKLMTQINGVFLWFVIFRSFCTTHLCMISRSKKQKFLQSLDFIVEEGNKRFSGV